MDHEWIVTVVDDKAAPITNATVAFTQSPGAWPYPGLAATHADSGGGVYKASPPITPVAGHWVLVVKADGKSPVVQHCSIAAVTTDQMQTVTATLDNKPALSVKTVVATLGKGIEIVGTTKVRRTRFTVKLFPATEVIILVGPDYFGTNLPFRAAANNYAVGASLRKRIDDGTVFTIFDGDGGTTHTNDRTLERALLSGNGQLTTVDLVIKGTGPRVTSPNTGKVGVDISIVDLYTYVNAGPAAGTVREVNIFSHGFSGGPVLTDFTEIPPRGGATPDTNPDHTRGLPARAPSDFDARTKDFSSPNVDRWSNMSVALSGGARLRVWGCLDFPHTIAQTRAAQESKDRGESSTTLFTVESTWPFHGGNGGLAMRTKERTDQLRVRAVIQEGLRGSYPFALAGFLKQSATAGGVRGFLAPPPGAGSEFSTGPILMLVNTQPVQKTYKYYESEFGLRATNEPSDHGYVDYQKVVGLAAATKPPFSPFYFMFEVDFRGSSPVSKVTFDDNRRFVVSAEVKDVKVTEQTTFGTAGHGVLYEMDHPSDKLKSKARFVDDGGKIFPVTLDASGQFTVLGSAFASGANIDP